MLGKVWTLIVCLADAALAAYLVASIVSFSVVDAVEMAVFLVPALVLLTRSAFVGLCLDERGALVMNPIRTMRVPWDEIDRFELIEGDGKTRIVKTNRKSVYMWGVQQWGWATTFGWTDTPERRWVEEWNAMLAEHRGATAP